MKRKMMRKFILHAVCVILIGMGSVNSLKAADLSVRIFSEMTVKKFQFTSILGSYKVLDANNAFIVDIPQGESIILQVENDEVKISNADKVIGNYPAVSFDGGGIKSIFKITPEPNIGFSERYYDDHLEVSIENNQFFMVNVVDLENYVAGVIQSEVHGSSENIDFFKIQAIISRTYAMNNMQKHAKEGYHLCDGVHCQAYKSRNNKPAMLIAAVETAGQVIVDSNKDIITASFFSNSGGQTCNSEDVWAMSVPYLRSVADTFSLEGRSANWEKQMPQTDWLNFLQKTYKYNINNPVMRDSALNFTQNERKVYFCGQIPLKFIRRDLNLRSTFFSVSTDGNTVTLKGKGYGHGVGLSQEGAIRMIDLGYNIPDVIRFYYPNVSVMHVDELPSDELGD